SKHDREVKRVEPIVDEINVFAEKYQALSDEGLRGKTAEFKQRIKEALSGIEDAEERKTALQEALNDLVPEAFAAVKEVCRRLVGQTWDVVGIPIPWDMVPYDEQLIGGTMLHEGKIAEM